MQDPKLGKSRGASDLSVLWMSQPVLLLLSGHNHKVGRAVVLLHAEYRVTRGDRFSCIFDFGHFLFLRNTDKENLFLLVAVVKICALAWKHIVGQAIRLDFLCGEFIPALLHPKNAVFRSEQQASHIHLIRLGEL